MSARAWKRRRGKHRRSLLTGSRIYRTQRRMETAIAKESARLRLAERARLRRLYVAQRQAERAALGCRPMPLRWARRIAAQEYPGLSPRGGW